MFVEPAGAKSLWLLLQQYADVPDKGRRLFRGTLAQKNERYREFRNFVRQARAYWDAGERVSGSASALLYYYCFLNLAKAEILAQSAAPMPVKIRHGLTHDPRGTDSVRSDHLTVRPGVFQELLKARTGSRLPDATRIPVMSLLSQIPEIGMEMDEFGLTRPRTTPAYHVVAQNPDEAWVLLALPEGGMHQREPLQRLLNRHFDDIRLDNWWSLFALSARVSTAELRILQSKRTFFTTSASGQRSPDADSASHFARDILASHASDAIGFNCDLMLSHSLMKSKPFAMPLGLARYAAMFYISSLVRYKPSALDPVRKGPRRGSWTHSRVKYH
ncbi:MAG: hypothetical protein J0I87_13660 [Cellulomonas sp.]|nr:hypothetical protein [Cellulomonas sp.]